MKQKTSALLKLLILVPLFAMMDACGGGDGGDGGGGGGGGVTAPEADPAVTGRWNGDAGDGDIDLLLSQEPSGSVTGTGSVIGDITTCLALTVSSGTHVFPNVNITLAATGIFPDGTTEDGDLNLTGTVNSANEMSATLNGRGFDNQSVTLELQDDACAGFCEGGGFFTGGGGGSC